MAISNNEPYFYINGYKFRIGVEAKSTSDLNIKENKMYVAKESWGYTDLQWSNFVGEELPIEIYSRVTEIYSGDTAQPDWGGISTFYNTPRTPHAVLKYWAQIGCPCNVVTNLEAYESGQYLITSFSQENQTYDVIKTELTLKQYEKPESVVQTYWKPVDLKTITVNSKSNQELSGTAKEIQEISDCSQTCSCTENTSPSLCNAPASENVKVVQKYLRNFGYFPIFTREHGRLDITGRYCYTTTQAIMALQQDYGLTINGRVNKQVKEVFMKLAGVHA
ncbi:peptidoglycan-binding domain-containing protein [Methanosphaera sp.]